MTMWDRASAHPLALILGLLLIRLVVLPFIVLIPEEAYYWMYSKHPALGYLDHPPAIAWLISAGTRVFGDTELGVRIGAWLLGAGAIWLCYRLADEWGDRRTAVLAAVLFSVAPMTCGVGLFATPDAPLLFFWLMALFGISRAYRRDSFGWWILAGVGTGLAFLSKYPAIFLPLGAVAFLMSDARGRRMLRRPGPWAAALVALLAASPVMVWNARHDWASFRFQFTRRLDQQGIVQSMHTLEWVAAQFGFMTPLIFAALCVTLWLAIRRFRRDRTGRWRFALCFAAPWLTVCTWHGLFAGVHINWPLPAYLSLLPAMSLVLRTRALPILRRLGESAYRVILRRYVLTVAAIDLILLAGAALRIPFVPLPRILSPWDRLARAAEKGEEAFHRRTGHDPFIVADGKYDLASELGFYMRDSPDEDWRDVMPAHAALGKGVGYGYWHDPQDFIGRNAIFIASAQISSAKSQALASAFEQVDEPHPFFTSSCGLGDRQTYWLVTCHRFRGVPSAPCTATQQLDLRARGFPPAANEPADDPP